MKKLLISYVVQSLACPFVYAKGGSQGGGTESYPTAVPAMPIAQTKAGQLKGFVDHNGVLAFNGIQYAEVPERYTRPQPVKPWTGVKPAQAYGAVPLIPEKTSIAYNEFAWPHRYGIQAEICQFLNVWTPALTGKRPVMIFMHGGNFNNGSAQETVAYEGGNLAQYGDVVVVTVNHRLNVLGYLNLTSFGNKYHDTANLGQYDLIAALQWVKDNIANFGGDPGKVLIFGQSGGCRKVQSLMHMPEAQGLFHKAIGHSSIYNPITPHQQQADRIARLTVQNLGLTAATIDQIKTIDYRTLLAAGVKALADAGKEFGIDLSGWNVTIDEKTLLSMYPEFAKSIPYMQGTVFSEIANNNLKLIAKGINKNDWTVAQTDQYIPKRFGNDAALIKAEFIKLFPEKKPQDILFYDVDRRNASLEFLADKAKTGTVPVYNYLFTFEAPANGGITSFHCSELAYVFHNVSLREITRVTGGTADCCKVQDTVATAWVNFARNGNPGGDWKPFDPNTRTGTMILDTNSRFAALDDANLRQLMGIRNLPAGFPE
jgi:para-nitrobenzyl esterase